MAAVSYDSVAALQHFAKRKGITYPLLSDPDSKIIRAFGVLNDNFPRDHVWYGVPFPGTFVVDENGIIRAKYFEEDHRERYTASNILVRYFGNGTSARTEVETKHLKLTSSASESAVRPGNRIALALDVEPKPGMHVYGPGVEGGYIPVEWKIASSSGWLAHTEAWPPSTKLHLAAIRETAPVHRDRFRVTRDLTIGQNQEIRPLLTSSQELVVTGSFRYQACDDKECYPPQTIPLQWVFRVQPHDTERAPAELRRAK